MKQFKFVHVTNEMVPTIVAFDPQNNCYVVGSDARLTGISGKTSIFNFKIEFGEGDKTFTENKKYWYYYPSEKDPFFKIETLSAKEAANIFLQELLSKVPQPEKLIIGEPAIREQQWKDNFRRHMREVLGELGHSEIRFFPEPFAVFQYYRNVEGIFPAVTRSQNVLIIDIGGGTFNSCLIRTTPTGYLARGGATAVPLGLQAVVLGGYEIDRQLLEMAIAKAGKEGVKWKDNPMERANEKGMQVLLLIEDAKIDLSNRIGTDMRLGDDVSSIRQQLLFTKGMLHHELDISIELTGEDLKSVLRKTWRKHWGPTVIKTVNEAKQKLKKIKATLDTIDLVLVAGGSANLPFTKEEIAAILPTMTDSPHIYIGTDVGTAVAHGIAWECKEQSTRDPGLSVGRIAPCVLNDLYIGFKRTRRDAIELPKVNFNGKSNNFGQLLSSPFETEDMTVEYVLEVPFALKDKLYYYFIDSPSEGTNSHLNHMNDVLSTQTKNKVFQKLDLSLAIKRDGTITPTFFLQEKGKGAKKDKIKIECPEFYIANFSVIEGESFCGVDFGSSNSYVTRFIIQEQEDVGVEYPVLELSQRVKMKLQEFQETIELVKSSGVMNLQTVLDHAKDQTLSIVFHSNKIEGNPLTKGETEDAITKYEKGLKLSKDDKEAVNMEQAYLWMLENFATLRDEPLAFIRHINKMVRDGIDRDAGEYRTKKVTIGGVGYIPPLSTSVPSFMDQLGSELKEWADDRSVIEFAASMHTKLVWIHPFGDGNGRTARILLNAILLCEILPVIVVNYADKSRYIDALEESNKGKISSLVEFFLECFEEEIEIFKKKQVEPSEQGEKAIPDLTPYPIRTEEGDEIIGEAIEEVLLRDLEDPLGIVLEQKAETSLRKEKARFEASLQAFSTLLSETRAVAEVVAMNPKYKYLGFNISLEEYDTIDFDKYLAALSGSKIPITWYFSVKIEGPNESEKLLLAFNKYEDAEVKGNYDIAVELLRFDGQEYRRLSSEPISLRYVCYHNGQLTFIHNDGSIIEGRVRHEISLMIAEVIKSYL